MKEGQKDGRKNGFTDGRKDGRNEGTKEGQKDGGKKGFTDGRKDGRNERGWGKERRNLYHHFRPFPRGLVGRFARKGAQGRDTKEGRNERQHSNIAMPKAPKQ
jgi:hypothetical protein